MYIKTTRNRVRMSLGRMSAMDKVIRARAVYANMKDNPGFPDPPVDMEMFQAVIDSLAGAIGEALADGGMKATANKKDLERILSRMLHQLARYVEHVCDGKPELLLSSGFDVLSNERKQTSPRSESIRKIEHGANSGQIRVRLLAVPGAASYELRWAAVDANGNLGTWASKPVVQTRQPTLIDGLIPGTKYVFEARALIAFDFTAWSGPAHIMCI